MTWRGVYVADTNTMDLITGEGHYKPVSPSITLFPDGAIVITNIPDWWNTFGQACGGFDSGRGFWRVEKHRDWWAVLGCFTNTAQFASLTNKSERFGSDMMLIGEKPPYKIHLIIGDPDEGRGMEFEKSAEAR